MAPTLCTPHGTPGAEKVDELSAVGGDEAGTLRFGDEQRVGVYVAAGTDGAVHAAGNDLLGVSEKFMGTLGIHILLLLRLNTKQQKTNSLSRLS